MHRRKRTMGYLYAIATSLLFTAYVIPKKLSRQSATVYSLFQGAGFFAASALFYLLSLLGAAGESLLHPLLLLSALAGVIWFSASVFFLKAIDRLGLSRANQWKNLQGPFGVLFNLVFLAEYTQVDLRLLIAASLLILLSAVLLTCKNETERQVDRSGIIYALLAAVLFGCYAMLMKNATNHGFRFSQQIYTAAFTFLSALVLTFTGTRRADALAEIRTTSCLPGLLGGALFGVTFFLTAKAYSLLPGSVAFTIIQLNAVWTVLVGVAVFHEIDARKNLLRILGGIVCAVAGVLVLLSAS